MDEEINNTPLAEEKSQNANDQTAKTAKKISNTEWFLVVSALFTVDMIQILMYVFLAWIGVGLILVSISSAIASATFTLYCYFRGIKIFNVKKMANIVGCSAIEILGIGANWLPMLTAQGLIAWALENAGVIPLAGETIKKVENLAKK